MAWRCPRWMMWCSEFPSDMTQDDCAKEGEQPAALYNCQGSHTQIWYHPIHQACNCEGLTHIPHNARPNQITQGVGQGIHWGHEDTTQLVAGVPLNQGCSREVTQQQAKRQVAGFWLPTAQFEETGWWDPPTSLCDLHHDKFLPPGTLRGPQDIWETRKERTQALEKALQSCPVDHII